MEYLDWKSQAQSLFFEERKSIVEIASQIGISPRSISAYLRDIPGYMQERHRRKEENKRRRKEYQRNWDRANRSGSRYTAINGDTMRREHELAAMIMETSE